MRSFQSLENQTHAGKDITDWEYAQRILPEWLAWANRELGMPADTFLDSRQLMAFPGLAACAVCARDDWDLVAQLMARAQPLGNRLQWVMGDWGMICYVEDQRYEIMNMVEENAHSERITYRQAQAILLAKFA